MNRWRHTVGLAVLFAVVPGLATAHSSAPDLALFGPFGAGSVRCLAAVSHSVQHCFNRVLALRRWCADGDLRSRPCDPTRQARLIAAATERADGSISRACSGGQLTELRLGTQTDAREDALTACSKADSAFAAMYPPTLAPEAMPSAAARACARRAAAVGHKLLRTALRLENRALARMSATFFPPSKKRSLLSDVDARLARMRAGFEARVSAACPQFEALYGRTLLDFQRSLRAAADCVIGLTYVQTAVTCR